MKLAIPFEDGAVFEHFDRSAQFCIYTVADYRVQDSITLPAAGLSHQALALMLRQSGVDVILCNQIAEEAVLALEAAGLSYGTGFALAYAGRAAGWFNALPLDYFFAPADKAALRRLSAKTDVSSLSLDSDETALLTVTAVLKNGRKFAYVPVSLRVSPPYLDWDASRGALSVLPGAEAGTVQIRGGVDKTAFRTKIKLKKQ